MNKGFEELNQLGIRGIAAFWLRLLLFLLMLGVFIFSIYWIAISSSKIWISSVGGSILATNVFLMLFSIASFGFLVLCRINKPIISVQFTHQIYAILSFVGQIICCILMTLSNSSHAETYLRSIEDYCYRNPNEDYVIKFIQKNPSEYSKYNYVAKRSTDLYASISSFFGIWFASTIIYLVSTSGIPDTSPEGSPLLSNQQPQPLQPEENYHGNDQENQSAQNNDENNQSTQNHTPPDQIPVQPWVLNPEEQNNDDYEEDDDDEINITTNNSKPIQNTSPNNSNSPKWVIDPKPQNIDQDNTRWVRPQGDDPQSYDYDSGSYNDEG